MSVNFAQYNVRMQYISTRGGGDPVSFSAAVEIGLAPDGGLYIPEQLPDLRPFLARWQGLDYATLAREFFALFATDLSGDALQRCIDGAYAGFDDPAVAPLRQLGDGLWVLELFHGPTLAFKDFALQLLGRLYEEQIRRSGQPINVLGATSGDTGSAAIHGLLGRDGVRIFILYPDGRVSPLQERQMTCTGADSVFPIAIDGTFDDAQAIVKELFADVALKQALNLSAVNSINLARILAQCVYYLHAWLQLDATTRETVEFVVPTGNFGNVFAGWLLRRMIGSQFALCVATNRNDILYRFFTTGTYAVAKVEPSLAPSMDIQVASNFERFLYYHLDGDCRRLQQVMAELKNTGQWHTDAIAAEGWRATRCDDGMITRTIADVYQRYGYIADPHTACAFAARRADRPQVMLATAHPAKFPDAIMAAIGEHPVAPALEELKDKPICKFNLPATSSAVRTFIQNNQ